MSVTGVLVSPFGLLPLPSDGILDEAAPVFCQVVDVAVNFVAVPAPSGSG
jgi:hypothetical protein